MSRTNRKMRAIERRARNKGPAFLSKIADKKVEDEAVNIVTALYDAVIKRHNATAAGLLVDLAESAEYADNPLYAKARSLAMQWSKEPQVVLLDTSPQIAPTPAQPQLTDGSAPDKPAATTDAETLVADPLDDQLETEANPPAGAATQASSVTSADYPGSPSSQTKPEILEGEYEMVSALASQQPSPPNGPPANSPTT